MPQTLDLLKALADGNRLRVMAALFQAEELCACQLIDLLGVSGATTSRHLALLAGVGLIAGRREGRWIYYRLGPVLAEQPQLRDWLASALQSGRDSATDRRALMAILRCRPEDICARQRQDRCC
jgi:ArsR family transcriptional regulator, arsenate/arsenite/antimonite-responsive transcriptional repressor